MAQADIGGLVLMWRGPTLTSSRWGPRPAGFARAICCGLADAVIMRESPPNDKHHLLLSSFGKSDNRMPQRILAFRRHVD